VLNPHEQRPHISEFKKVLTEEFGCRFKNDRFEFGDGVVFDYTYIERKVEGETKMYPIDNYSDDMKVHELLLLSVCRYFRLDCSRWGVTLDHLDDEMNNLGEDFLN
jgi:hypothetical protein